MLTAIMYLILARAQAIIRVSILDEIRHQIHKAKHFLCAFTAAIEGHILLVFVYPHLYPAIHFISHLTGIDFSSVYYH